MTSKVAFVTGASRGIGKVGAQYLARAGYDVAITARTVQEGEAREHSSTLAKSNMKPLPGSLELRYCCPATIPGSGVFASRCPAAISIPRRACERAPAASPRCSMAWEIVACVATS